MQTLNMERNLYRKHFSRTILQIYGRICIESVGVFNEVCQPFRLSIYSNYVISKWYDFQNLHGRDFVRQIGRP